MCRACSAELTISLVDLGMSPLSNAYLDETASRHGEPFFPLHPRICGQCLLVQLEQFHSPDEIFGDYAYFSSYSDSWLRHAEAYTELMIARFGLGAAHRVVEIASNDGYLLRFFRERGVPILGVEPAANVARVAEDAGIPTLVRFFGRATAEAMRAAGQRADLLLGNNVLAHVPDLNDFVSGMAVLLEPAGVITMEFPHLLRLLAGNQFDTIYHEHFSYFSLLAVRGVFARHQLVLFDAEELPTHGGSLRIYAQHAASGKQPESGRLASILAKEREFGLDRIETYQAFAEQVARTKREILDFLIAAKRQGRSIVGYGAPAKGNTLLNYCGIRQDFLDYTVDRSPHKQGRLLPGTRIPIHPPERIFETRPDYVFILPWNLKDEIVSQLAGIRDWGGKFVIPVPAVELMDP